MSVIKNIFSWSGHVCCVVVCLLFLTSCSNRPLTTSHEQVNMLVIRNRTSATLQNVDLRVPDRGVLVSSNLILPGRAFSLGFPSRVHARKEATLSWQHRSYQYTKNINIHIPDKLDTSYPARIVILVGDNGQVWSEIEAYTP